MWAPDLSEYKLTVSIQRLLKIRVLITNYRQRLILQMARRLLTPFTKYSYNILKGLVAKDFTLVCALPHEVVDDTWLCSVRISLSPRHFYRNL